MLTVLEFTVYTKKTKLRKVFCQWHTFATYALWDDATQTFQQPIVLSSQAKPQNDPLKKPPKDKEFVKILARIKNGVS